MKIATVDVLDLFGDGTLVMKTTVDEPGTAMRYAFYVKENGKNIFKSAYQTCPYMGFRLEHLGSYVIKAFARNGTEEAVHTEVSFDADKRTSPKLAKVKKPVFPVTPVVSHVSGNFWQFSLVETFVPGTKFAWYIHQEGTDTPIIKTPYTEDSKLIHQFEESGRYYVKGFVVQSGTKRSAKSGVFTVVLDT